MTAALLPREPATTHTRRRHVRSTWCRGAGCPLHPAPPAILFRRNPHVALCLLTALFSSYKPPLASYLRWPQSPPPTPPIRPATRCSPSHSFPVYLTLFLAVTLTRSLSHSSQSLPHLRRSQLYLFTLTRSLSRSLYLSLLLTCLSHSLLTRSTQGSISCTHRSNAANATHRDHMQCCVHQPIYFGKIQEREGQRVESECNKCEGGSRV